MFQSSFELTGYITFKKLNIGKLMEDVSKLFRAYRLYNVSYKQVLKYAISHVSKLFRAYRLYNDFPI